MPFISAALARIRRAECDPSSMTPPSSIFRVAPYSPSTSRVTVHRDNAAHLHKFLADEGMALEAMTEATGTVLRGYVDEAGGRHLEAEVDIITFVADATPSMFLPGHLVDVSLGGAELVRPELERSELVWQRLVRRLGSVGVGKRYCRRAA